MNTLSDHACEFVFVDERGHINSRISSSAKSYGEALGNEVVLEVVVIPAVRFLMGSASADSTRSADEIPQHEVSLSSFGLGKYPVTQAQYQAVMGSNPSMFSGAKNPVENVNWHQAADFCARLQGSTGKEYRLPTEAEWEYACKAGTKTIFSFGNMITTELANYQGEVPWGSGSPGLFRCQTTAVGHFYPNPFGLYDMHGNVFEWCEDVYHSNYDGAPTDGSAWVTHSPNEMRVLRGGSWYHTPIACASTTRLRIQPAYRAPDIGFRVAVSMTRSNCFAP